MSLLGEIDKLITEHGSAAILREKVGLLELQRGHAVAERDKALLELADAKKKIEVLESQLQALALQKAVPHSERDVCPHCHQPTGKRGSYKPRRPGGTADVYTYHCTNCGKSYEKRHDA